MSPRKTYSILSRLIGLLHFLLMLLVVVEDCAGATIMEPSASDISNYTMSTTRDSYKISKGKGRVHEPYKANERSRYAEVVFVVDHEEYIWTYESNLTEVHSRMIALANLVNSLYFPLNIFIALVGVEVWTERNQIDYVDQDTRGGNTIDKFLNYRRDKLSLGIPNDIAILFTNRNYPDILGNTLKSAICSPDYSGAIIADHSVHVAATTAHEIGHLLGMDDEYYYDADCECLDDCCIMFHGYTLEMQVHRWSSCSLRGPDEIFNNGGDFCLRNVPESLFKSPTCGNSFVEDGEQCECGAATEGDCVACCDPHTCMLRRNATCGAGICCDFTTCNFKSASTVCRSAENECDLPEYCTGDSDLCPDDVFKLLRSPCGEKGDKICINKKCFDIPIYLRLLHPPCSGHGVYNTLTLTQPGHCHCDPGYAQPDCHDPGLEGSTDSGPVNTPNGDTTMVQISVPGHVK